MGPLVPHQTSPLIKSQIFWKWRIAKQRNMYHNKLKISNLQTLYIFTKICWSAKYNNFEKTTFCKNSCKPSYRPHTSFSEGNVFSRVCVLFCLSRGVGPNVTTHEPFSYPGDPRGPVGKRVIGLWPKGLLVRSCNLFILHVVHCENILLFFLIFHVSTPSALPLPQYRNT